MAWREDAKMTAGARAMSLLPYAGIPALAAALLVIKAGNTDSFVLIWSVLVTVFGYIAAVVDLKTKQIPNGLHIAMAASWILTMGPMLFIDIEKAITLLKDAALGAALGGGIFLVVYIISRKGLGGGDVKFMAAAGLYLGLSGTISSILYGALLSAILAAVLLIAKKIGRKDSLPLAPFLYIGILATLFFG